MNNKIKLLDPYQILGLIDAEGCFSIIKISSKNSYRFEFKISQMGYSKGLLLGVKKHLNCGQVSIENKKHGSMKFSITKKNELKEILLPFIEKYELQSSKNLDFKSFKEAILLSENGNEAKILALKNSMNNSRSNLQRYNYTKNKTYNLTNGWLSGFIEGDGSFQFYIGKKEIYASLEISQHFSNRYLLKAIKLFLNNEGLIKPKNFSIEKGPLVGQFGSGRLLILESTLIPILDSYNFLSIKNKDYNDWKVLINMKKKRCYNTSGGLKTMIKIKNNRNRIKTN